MARIEWRPEFATGVPDVDFEHQELIAWINRAIALARESGEPRPAVTAALGEIYAKIAAHFALEERVMAARRYDQVAPHKRDHETLLDDIRDIMDDCEAGEGAIEERFAGRLSDWFGVHFRTHDARFHHALPDA